MPLITIPPEPEKTIDLEEQYRICNNQEIKRKILAILKIEQGYSRRMIAQFMEIDRNTITRWVKQLNQQGIEGLRARHGGGKPRLLNQEEDLWLKELLGKHPRELKYSFSNWTLALLIIEIKKKTGKMISRPALSQHLKRLGIRRVIPHAVPANAAPKKKKHSNNPSW